MINVTAKGQAAEVKVDSIDKPMDTIIEALACCKSLSIYIRDTFGENGDKAFKEGLRKFVLETTAADDAGKVVSADADVIRKNVLKQE